MSIASAIFFSLDFDNMMPHQNFAEYVLAEIKNLQQKQASVQADLDAKLKETQALRETLLVMSGAIQGLQHIHQFIMTDPDGAKARGSVPDSSSSESSDPDPERHGSTPVSPSVHLREP